MDKNDKLKSYNNWTRRKQVTAKLNKISARIIKTSHVAAQPGHGMH